MLDSLRAPERAPLALAFVVAVATLFMLQATRVFVGYLVFVVDQSQRVTLGLTALAVFSAPAIAWLLLKVIPAHRVLVGSSVILVVARLTLQFWENPTARLVLGAVVIATWGWLMIVTLGRARRLAALGILVTLLLDLALRMSRDTIDLPWMPDSGAHMTTITWAFILLIFLVTGSQQLEADDEGTNGRVLPLLALGPALALYHLTIGNLALGPVMLAQDRGTVWSALLVGILLGCAVLAARAVGMLSRRLDTVLVAASALIGGAGLWLLWSGGSGGLAGIVLATAGFLVLLGAILASGPEVTVAGPGPVAAAITGGLVLQVVLLFVYYTFTGLALIVPIAWVLLALGALASGRLPALTVTRRVPGSAVAASVVLLLLFVLSIGEEVAVSEPKAQVASGSELTVMVYNIQSGFASDKRWDLGEIARVIQEQDPDIVVLNEVSRGWLATTGNDQLPWLSRELAMPYVWGPASDDDLWGNAVLSRLPIDVSEVKKFASTDNLKRSATGVLVDVNGTELWVFGTHLDNPAEAGEARMEQVTELLDFWDSRVPAVVMGDFNAEPDDDVIAALLEQGFEDPGAGLGADATTSSDDRRIDYIFTSSGIEVRDIWIPNVTASDHKPVVARIVVSE